MKTLFSKLSNLLRSAKARFDKWIELDENEINQNHIQHNPEEFKCHICLLPGTSVTVPDDYRSSIWGFASSFMPVVYVDVPINLTRCIVCHKWTCEQHLNNHGVCQACESEIKRGE